MKDNEQEFMSRYNFAAGEREFKKNPIVEGFKFISGRREFLIALGVTMFMAVALVGATFLSAYLSSKSDFNSKIGAAYGVTEIKEYRESVPASPARMKATYDGREVNCKIPSDSDIASKVSLTCTNGITIQAR